MKHLSSKEFSEMLKQHKQETKVAHKKKLYNKITKEVKNLSMENNDRRKILNSYQRFLKKQSGGDNKTTQNPNDSNIQNIPKNIMTKIKADLVNLSNVCAKIKSKVDALSEKLQEGADNDSNFNANSVKALYDDFSKSALLKEPIEQYYNILNNPNLIGKFSNTNTKKGAHGNPLGKFVEKKGSNTFLSDVIFSKIAIGAYDNDFLPNELTESAYKKWPVQSSPVETETTLVSEQEEPAATKTLPTLPPVTPTTTSVSEQEKPLVTVPVKFKEGNIVQKKNDPSWKGTIENESNKPGKYFVKENGSNRVAEEMNEKI